MMSSSPVLFPTTDTATGKDTGKRKINRDDYLISTARTQNSCFTDISDSCTPYCESFENEEIIIGYHTSVRQSSKGINIPSLSSFPSHPSSSKPLKNIEKDILPLQTTSSSSSSSSSSGVVDDSGTKIILGYHTSIRDRSRGIAYEPSLSSSPNRPGMVFISLKNSTTKYDFIYTTFNS